MLNHLTDPVAASSNYSELCDTTSIPGEFAFTSVEDLRSKQAGPISGSSTTLPKKWDFWAMSVVGADSVVTLTAAMDSTCS